MNASMQRIALLVSIAIGIVWVNRPDSTESTPTIKAKQPFPSPQAPKAAKKRARTGPRKPPPAAMAIPQNEPTATDDELTVEEQKLETYLEYFEALENPNVDELTMLGEMAFEAQENQAAYDHYLEVIDNHSDDPKSAFALYKLAWTEYNLGDVDAAIDDMELMLEWLDEGDGPLFELLRTAGPNDLALFKKKALH